MSHIQLGWSFCRGKVSCVSDWQRPEKRASGRKPILKKKFAVAGSVSEHNWFLLTFPPPILNSIKRFCLKTRCINMGHLVYF